MKRRLAIVACVLPLGACNHFQTALGGNGVDGANFVSLFTIFMIVCTVMYVLVVGALLAALWHARRAAQPLTVEDGRHHEEPAWAGRALTGWGLLILAGLSGLTVASFFTDRSNAKAAQHPRLLINITGNQWWWDVQYDSADSSQGFHTANELHLPVNTPVEVKLQSNDVIHSLWIPNLAGKQDLIPGRLTDIQLNPRKIGIYRGQCAEFCGVQHAHMAIDVTVESRADFERWVANQQRTAVAPSTPIEMAGYRYFISRQCSACHAISGTPANGTVAPDLTHIASRRSIAAGTMPMSPDNLYRWVADPQHYKPGSNMPPTSRSPDEMRAVVAYLEKLH
jgi:cytochrome c oxidase subunit II